MGEEQSESTELISNQNKQTALYIANFGVEFDYLYNNVFSNEKLDLIDDFLDHYEYKGLYGWKGKIANSWTVPSTYADWESRAEFAQRFNLWHAHIGLPTWESYPNVPFQTSNQVLHFQKINRSEIKLLTISSHNPMDLPDLEHINDHE